MLKAYPEMESSEQYETGEADFYGLIMGVRSRNHSLKGMKLKLRAYEVCLITSIPIQERTLLNHFLSLRRVFEPSGIV